MKTVKKIALWCGQNAIFTITAVAVVLLSARLSITKLELDAVQLELLEIRVQQQELHADVRAVARTSQLAQQ